MQITHNTDIAICWCVQNSNQEDCKWKSCSVGGACIVEMSLNCYNFLDNENFLDSTSMLLPY